MSTPESSVCQHQQAEPVNCVLCNKAVCWSCAYPLPQHQALCETCFHKLKAENAQVEDDPDDPMSSFFDFQRAPLAFIFCGVLVGLYALGSLPDLVDTRSDVLQWVNLDRAVLMEGEQLWRLLTGNLFHVNLGHVGMNVFGLLIFGNLLEARIGWQFLLAWMVISLIGCNIASLYFGVPHSVGASGIAYGLQTAFIVLSAKTLIAHRHQSLWRTARSLIGYLAVIIVMNTFYTGQMNIYGHLGGAAAGLLCALAYPAMNNVRLGHKIALGFLFVMSLLSLGWVLFLPA